MILYNHIYCYTILYNADGLRLPRRCACWSTRSRASPCWASCAQGHRIIGRGDDTVETLIGLILFKPSFSSFLFDWNNTNNSLYRAFRANCISIDSILPSLLATESETETSSSGVSGCGRRGGGALGLFSIVNSDIDILTILIEINISLSLYIYIYIYTHIHICIYIYIYIDR